MSTWRSHTGPQLAFLSAGQETGDEELANKNKRVSRVPHVKFQVVRSLEGLNLDASKKSYTTRCGVSQTYNLSSQEAETEGSGGVQP